MNSHLLNFKQNFKKLPKFNKIKKPIVKKNINKHINLEPIFLS